MKCSILCAALAAMSLPISADAANPHPTSAPDVEGVWAQKLVTTSASDAPIIGAVASQTLTYQKVTIDQSGTSLEWREKTCEVSVQSDQHAVETHIPARFVDHLPTVTRPASLSVDGGVAHLNVPKQTKYAGIRSTIGSDPLPHEPDDPRIFDQDRDGHPGVTIKLSGVLAGDLYLIQRSWDVLAGKRYKSGQFAGPVKWHNDRIVVEKSGRIFGDMSASTPVSDKSYFRLVPVDDDTTCQDIVEHKNDIF